MSSRAVTIADLGTNLSVHLARVRGGEEILVRDRHYDDHAKIVPFALSEGVSADEEYNPRRRGQGALCR